MATTMTRPPAPANAGSPAPRRTDRTILGLGALLVGAPVLRMISIVAHPLDTEDAAQSLAHIDDVAARWAIVHILEPTSMVLLAVAAFVLLRLVPDRGRRLARVGAPLFAAGSIAMGMLVYAHGEAYLNMTHTSVDQSQMVALYDRFHEGVPLVAPLVPFFFLGACLLAAGLYVSGNVPRLAAVAFFAATVLPNLIPQEDSLVLAGIVGSAPMILGMAAFAVALARRSQPVEPTQAPVTV